MNPVGHGELSPLGNQGVDVHNLLGPALLLDLLDMLVLVLLRVVSHGQSLSIRRDVVEEYVGEVEKAVRATGLV
jgi:hypothetical protein